MGSDWSSMPTIAYGAVPFTPDDDWLERLRRSLPLVPTVPVEQPNPTTLLPALPTVIDATDDQRRAFAIAVLTELYTRLLGVAGQYKTKSARALFAEIGKELSKMNGDVLLKQWPEGK